MDENTTEILLAVLGVASVIFGKWQAGKLSALTAEVKSLTKRTIKLENDVAMRDNTIKLLRIRIEEYQKKLEELLREIAKGRGNGIF